MSNLTPGRIVKELDKHIIGQSHAKKAVAIALRNRWRRMHTDEAIRHEITPKNILMIGPTGVGKTEISRRLAILCDAPFIKIEATKFTEVGYVGRDVESIIRDLVNIAYKKEHQKALNAVQHIAHQQAVDMVLDTLLPKAEGEEQKNNTKTREKFKDKILRGEMDNKEIEANLSLSSANVEISAPMGMEEMTSQLQDMFKNMQKRPKKRRKVAIKEALKSFRNERAEQLIDNEKIKQQTLNNVSENGIVFIDEIDKITHNGQQSSGSVSREGVQRDLLPLIEGCSVVTKYGVIDTDHILFIASGAFHLSKPADLIPELQGRLPIRVELRALTIDDFYRILTEPDVSLVEQYEALLKTEGFALSFEKKALKRLAELAYDVNENTENIGARRLHTLLEKLLEDICFDVPESSKKSAKINADYVDEKLSALSQNQDLSRYIL